MRKRISLAIVALLIVLGAMAAWWVGQTAFVRFALDRAVLASEGRLSYADVGGTLFDGVRIGRLEWRDPSSAPAAPAPAPGTGAGAAADGALTVSVDELRIGWLPFALAQRELDLTRVAARSVVVRMGASDAAPALPESLELPLGLRVRDLRITTLRVERAGASPIELRDIELRARYRERGYRIERLRVAGDWGSAQLNAQLADNAPFALLIGGRVDAKWRDVSAALVVDGNLSEMRLVGSATAPAAAGAPPALASLRTVIRPLDAQPLAPLALRVDDVDPAAFGLLEGLKMRLSGEFDARVELETAESGLRIAATGSLSNALAGPLADKRLPIASISTRLDWRDGTLALDALNAGIAGGARASGKLTIDTTRSFAVAGQSIPRAIGTLALRDLDLSQFVAALGKTRLSGTVSVDAGRFEVDLADGARGGVALAAAGEVEGERLTLARSLLRSIPGLGDATLDASGSVELREPFQAALSGRFARLDPSKIPAVLEQLQPADARSAGEGAAQWLARLAGSVDGRWSLQGPLGAALREPVRIELDVGAGSLAGLPARGSLRARLGLERIQDARIEFALGDTRIEASGALGAPGDRIEFSARAGSLAQLARVAGVDGYAGALRATGTLSGRLRSPAIALRASGSDLRLPDAVRVAEVELDATLPELTGEIAESRIELRASARALSVGANGVRSLRIDVSGTQASHQFSIVADAQPGSVRLSGTGARAGAGWRGTIAEFASTGKFAARLASPVAVELARDAVVAGAAIIESQYGRVSLARATWRDGRFEIAGEAAIDRLVPLAQAFGFTLPDAGGGVSVDDVGLDLKVDLAGRSIDDIGGRLFAKLRSPAAVAAGGEVDLSLRDGQLSGPLELRLPSLAFTNRIVGPEWLFDGALRFAGRVGGSIRQPRLSGDLRGDGLRLEQRAMGWRLGEGTLAGRFDGERFRVDLLKLNSRAKGGGSIEMRGEVLASNLEGSFDFVADRLVVPIGPGQRVVLSGDASASSRGGKFEINGRLKVDEGQIELVGGDAPKLPDDVVVREPGAARIASRISSTQAKLQIAADLKLDLGGNLRVHGSGIDARLAGVLTLRGTLPEAPRAFGTVSVRNGTYSAYGQKLEITRGSVIFNGPLDNPVLDIVALRRDQAVEAGVALSGTVLAPKIRLTSSPDVPDAEKLSWLVLGVPLQGASGAAQGAALQAAAATLFGRNDGGMSGGLKESLGLDVLTVRSASAGAGLLPSDFGAGSAVPGQIGGGSQAVAGAAATDNVVAVGKRLGSRVFLSYEQGLRGAWNLLRIQYDITARLSLRAQTGSESAIDLLLRHSFD